jgi:hypothetical protein
MKIGDFRISGIDQSVFCVCGASMRVHADLNSAKKAVQAFATVHSGDGHGPTDKKTARKARRAQERLQ